MWIEGNYLQKAYTVHSAYRCRKSLSAAHTSGISDEKKEIVKNLYISGIGEEFIALQLDLEIPVVIAILKELDVYQEARGL